MVFSIGYTSTPINHHQLILWKEHEGAFQVLVYLIFILYNLILQHYLGLHKNCSGCCCCPLK